MTTILVGSLALLGSGPIVGPPEAPRPTMVRLDFEDRTLAEIAAEITRRGPNAVEVAAEPQGPGMFRASRPAKPEPPEPRFRVVAPEPLPFWTALDRVGRASGHWLVIDPRTVERAVSLQKALPGRGFASNDGAFRVTLDGLHYSRSVTYAPFFFPQPGAPKNWTTGDTTTFTAALTLVVEPHLSIQEIGAPKLLEATDGRGRSLLIPGLEVSTRSPDFAQGGQSASMVVPLRPLDDQAPTLRRLRGTVALRVGNLPAPGPPEIDAVATFDFADVPMP